MRLVQVPDRRWTRGNAGEQCSRIAKKGWSCEAYAAGQAAAVAQGLGGIGLAFNGRDWVKVRNVHGQCYI